MARALDQILSELNSVYDPQRQNINKQISALDPAQQAEQQGLEAAKNDAFSQITDQANRRGLFYSGIPIKEQQQYTGANFLPAVANLKGRYAQQRFSLQDALNKVQSDQYNQAYGIRQSELDREAQIAAARAASSGGGGYGSPSFGFTGGGTANGQVLGASTGYNLQQRSNGGFNFQGPNGQAISAAQYSQATGIPFRTLLSQMAAAGDNGAKAALGLVGNDYGFNRGKVSSSSQVNLLKALGVNTGGYTYKAPTRNTQTQKTQASTGGSIGLMNYLTGAFR